MVRRRQPIVVALEETPKVSSIHPSKQSKRRRETELGVDLGGHAEGQINQINAVNKTGELCVRVGIIFFAVFYSREKGADRNWSGGVGTWWHHHSSKTSIGCVFARNLGYGHKQVHAISCRLRESKGTVV